MKYKHYCVIDAERYYKFLALAHLSEDEKTIVSIDSYKLQDGEQIVEANLPIGYVTPRWDGTTWQETATPEEIAAAQPPEPEPIAPQPDAAALAQQVTDLQLALAELYEGVLGNG